MAGEAELVQNQSLEADYANRKAAAARLYGQGYSRAEIARILLDAIIPNGRHRPEEMRLRQARGRLRQWERDPKFRDLIWELALVKTDLQTGQIMQGLVQKAKRGRVDAAKLALELTGRYTPKGEQQPTQVAVVFTGIQRSQALAELPPPPVDDDL
jgi:hypothetical protein